MRQNVLDMELRNEMFEQKLLKLLRAYGTLNEMTWKRSKSVPYLKKTQEDTARPLDKACVPPFRYSCHQVGKECRLKPAQA